MRWLPALLPLLLCHCSPLADPASLATSHPMALPVAPTTPPSAPAARSPRFALHQQGGIALSGVCFDDRSHRLIVVDQPGGPGSLHGSAAEAARAHGGLAAINGGFFTPQGMPLGLVIADGQTAGSWNGASSLGSGLYCETSRGPMLVRSSSLGKAAAMNCSQVLQAGPWLVEAGRGIPGLETRKMRERSLLLWDGGHRWWMGCSSPCSLDALSRHLLAHPPSDWPVHHALNLDGGSSTELWVDGRLTSGSPYQLHLWARPVRNHLVLLSRAKTAPADSDR